MFSCDAAQTQQIPSGLSISLSMVNMFMISIQKKAFTKQSKTTIFLFVSNFTESSLILRYNILFNGTITDPRQTNIRHDKPQTGKNQTRQTLDIISLRANPRHNKRQFSYVMYYVHHVQGLSCLVFAYLGFVISSVRMSRVVYSTCFNRTIFYLLSTLSINYATVLNKA